MSQDFRSLLRDYLDGKIPQYAVRHWISFNLDEPPADIVPLIHDAALAMWETDNHGGEADFRAAVAGLMARELAAAPGGDA